MNRPHYKLRSGVQMEEEIPEFQINVCCWAGCRVHIPLQSTICYKHYIKLTKDFKLAFSMAKGHEQKERVILAAQKHLEESGK